MRLPTLHVVHATAELSHLLHTLHELLRSKLPQEEVFGVEKIRVKELLIYLLFKVSRAVTTINHKFLVFHTERILRLMLNNLPSRSVPKWNHS